MFVASALIMIPVLHVTGTFAPLGRPWTAVEWSMLGLGFIAAVAFTMYFHLIDTAGAVFSSLTANLVTLFGVVWGIVIFGEQNSVWVWLSFATMMAALALVAPRKTPATAA
jgi:drug/metabolite transporter (DMT)-like permease